MTIPQSETDPSWAVEIAMLLQGGCQGEIREQLAFQQMVTASAISSFAAERTKATSIAKLIPGWVEWRPRPNQLRLKRAEYALGSYSEFVHPSS
jgi:hypothetical protein